jgi:uncharacterized protein with FMN-binding domain
MPNALPSRPVRTSREPGLIPWRGVGALLVTVGALALLLSFRAPDADPFSMVGAVALSSQGPGDPADRSVAAAMDPPPEPSPTPTLVLVATDPPPEPSPTPRVIYGPPAPGHEAATPTPEPVASATPTPEPAASVAPVTVATATAVPSDVTVTGRAVRTPYGNVQVEVTIKDGKITDITALQMPDSHRYSRQISEIAEPMLRKDALSAQSARIHVLSGATYTSEGYARSLQSALDQAGL